MPSEPTPSYPKTFAQRTVPPSAAFATSSSGLIASGGDGIIPAKGSRISITIFPAVTETLPIYIYFRNAAGSGWALACPPVYPGEYYFDNEYDGEILIGDETEAPYSGDFFVAEL